MADDDSSLFLTEVGDVRPIKFDRAEVGKPPPDQRQIAHRRQQAGLGPAILGPDGWSDQYVSEVGAEETLSWIAAGLQGSQLRRLKKGQMAIQGDIDLHGLSIEQARQQLQGFLLAASRQSLRCVRVVHGKASGSASGRALLKSHINSWLRQHPGVLGFHSCLARHGGAGAVYVLLRQGGA